MSLRFFLFALFLPFWHYAHAEEIPMTTVTAPTPISSVNHHLVTVVDRANRLPNGMHIERLALYSLIARPVKMKIVQRTGPGSYTVVSDTPWNHPGGGWQWVVIPTAYDVPASGDYFLAYYYPEASDNLINCNSLVPRATFDPDIGIGSYTGGIESTSDVAAMAASSDPGDMALRYASGIIRPDGSGGWYILNDGDHVPLNLASVEVQAEQVLVYFSTPFRQLVTFHVGVDDDLARARIMAGASTGLGKIGIVLTDDSGVVDPSTVTNTLANIQIDVTGYAP